MAKPTGRVLPDLEAENARLRKQLEEARAAEAASITFKVSPKGACSVYGLQRWPVTLYAGQWLALIDQIPRLQKFLEANRSRLATKGGDE